MDNEIVENFVNQKKDMILSVNNTDSGQRTNIKMLLHKSKINFEYFDITATDVFPTQINLKSLKETDGKVVVLDVDPSVSNPSGWMHLPEMIRDAKEDGLQLLVIVDNRSFNKPKTNSDAYFFSSTDELVNKLELINKGMDLEDNQSFKSSVQKSKPKFN
jgi:hypothetical protein